LNIEVWSLSFSRKGRLTADFAQDGEQFGPELTAEGLVEPLVILRVEI